MSRMADRFFPRNHSLKLSDPLGKAGSPSVQMHRRPLTPGSESDESDESESVIAPSSACGLMKDLIKCLQKRLKADGKK